MATIVLGSQFGDEGKGKLVDILCGSAKICVRCAGGNNAGHTIKANGITYDFHMLPSGLVNPSCINFIGEGVVIHIPSFFSELSTLQNKGLSTENRILISDRAHVVFDLHQLVDGLEEAELGAKAVGTTKKGIGPAYSTKAARSGMQVWEVLEKERFDVRLRRLAEGFKLRFGPLLEYNVEDEIKRFDDLRERLRPFVVDGVRWMHERAKEARAANTKGSILVEGANALMLDISFGTYPYCTSSATSIGGAFTGTALPHSLPREVIGVVKAYTTRVGAGPLPTESLLPSGQPDATGTALQELGHEWGVTTARKRRCAWLDLVIVKYSCAINDYTCLNLTKLDVLDGFEEVKVAVAYRIDGEEVSWFPANLERLGRAEMVYRTFEGWNVDGMDGEEGGEGKKGRGKTAGVREWSHLPENARRYVEFIEEYLGGLKCRYIGTGPGREDMIVR